MLGIVVPMVGVAVCPIWSFPSTQTPGNEIASWAVTNHSRLVVTMLLYTVGVTLWLAFGAAVWAYLRDHLGAGSSLPTTFAAGLIGYVTLLLAGFLAFDLLLYRQHSAEATSLLYDLTFGMLAMSGLPTAVSLIAFAIAVFAHRMLPIPPPTSLQLELRHMCCCWRHSSSKTVRFTRGLLDYGHSGAVVGMDSVTALAMPRQGSPMRDDGLITFRFNV